MEFRKLVYIPTCPEDLVKLLEGNPDAFIAIRPADFNVAVHGGKVCLDPKKGTASDGHGVVSLSMGVIHGVYMKKEEDVLQAVCVDAHKQSGQLARRGIGGKY